MADKTQHIELPVLHEFVCGERGMEAEARQHIETCEECRFNISWLRWLVEAGAKEKGYEPPSWALANAEKVFKLQKPGIVMIAKEIVATLVYDSFNEPLPIGVRRRDLPARQALYRTDNVQLDVKIELGEERGGGLIIGQIAADQGSMNVSGLRIELTQQGQVVGNSRTNALGEFIFQDLPKGNYELQVVLSDTMVKLPPLALNN